MLLIPETLWSSVKGSTNWMPLQHFRSYSQDNAQVASFASARETYLALEVHLISEFRTERAFGIPNQKNQLSPISIANKLQEKVKSGFILNLGKLWNISRFSHSLWSLLLEMCAFVWSGVHSHEGKPSLIWYFWDLLSPVEHRLESRGKETPSPGSPLWSRDKSAH